MNVLDPKDPLAAFEGRRGGRLWLVSAADGSRIAAYELASPPVFDGLIAACGNLYAALENGTVMCLGKRR